MTERLLFDTASEVSAANGEVQVDGPDGIAYAMTPDAAAETGRRLLAVSETARTDHQTATP